MEGGWLIYMLNEVFVWVVRTSCTRVYIGTLGRIEAKSNGGKGHDMSGADKV